MPEAKCEHISSLLSSEEEERFSLLSFYMLCHLELYSPIYPTLWHAEIKQIQLFNQDINHFGPKYFFMPFKEIISAYNLQSHGIHFHFELLERNGGK